LGFIGPLVVLGLLVFQPIVYKPSWDTFVFKFDFYDTVSFLSSLEVLLRTTDPYLWIFDSKLQIFLTYLGISSKWREFLPVPKTPKSTSSIFLIRSRVHTQIRFRSNFYPNPKQSFIKIWLLLLLLLSLLYTIIVLFLCYYIHYNYNYSYYYRLWL